MVCVCGKPIVFLTSNNSTDEQTTSQQLFLIMFKKILLSCLIAILPILWGFAETTKREAVAARIEEAPKIDGVLDDQVWQDIARIYQGVFTQIRPNNLEPSDAETEVWIAYTDYGLYIAAQLHDPDPSNIPSELGIRDDLGRNTDFFSFALDPYQNGQNAFHFFVTSAGVQADSYITNQGNQDFGWDAVWNSAFQKNDKGWSVEMEIPYSAIRFPKQSVQNWNVNFARRQAAKQEISSWNPVDNSQNGFVPQFGELYGIENITPPPRIFLTPYVTAYATYDGSTEKFRSSLTGGLDLKAGLNESFTLDMTLVPDFGQVRADNQVLNLGPFEIRFQENRPFFTEGTELFNQGPVFYSRRVGQSVRKLQEEISEDEIVTVMPREAPLLNATKITGRTPNGLGIGFFNAITNKTFATVQHTETKEERQVQVDPIANYNVLVGEKTFGHNSKFTLINTNVTRFNYNRNANVTRGNLSYFIDEGNTYRLNAQGTFSHIALGEGKRQTGYAYQIRFNKVAGNFQFGISRNVESDSLYVNDFGFLNAPNEISHGLWLSYNKFKPWFIFNNFNYSISSNISQMYDNREWVNRGVRNKIGGELKNFWNWEAWGSIRPFKDRDYFGTFTPGYYLEEALDYDYGTSLRTDQRKIVALRGDFFTWARPSWDQRDFGGSLNVRVRVSNQFNVNYGIRLNSQNNQRGFATHWNNPTTEQQEVIYGVRDWKSVENSFNANFTFTNTMGINLEVRHYWARVQNHYMQRLNTRGQLVDTDYNAKRFEYRNSDGTTYIEESPIANGDLVREFNRHDTNFNAFNVYLTYNWQIAPGSFVRVVYQDVLTTQNNLAYLSFMNNFKQATSVPHNQSLSVRLIYFLDYLTVRNLFKK